MGKIPLVFDLNDRSVVIFGGGSVGERKALKFVYVAGQVTVVSRDFTKNLRRLETNLGNLHLIEREIDLPLIKKYVSGAFIVISATNDPKLNSEIVSVARKHGKLVNWVDRPEDSDFTVPAMVRKKDIQIAISTGGKSPLISRYLKSKVKELITDDDVFMVELQNFARELAKRTILRQIDRKEILWQIFRDSSIRKLVKDGKYEEAKKKASALIFSLNPQGGMDR